MPRFIRGGRGLWRDIKRMNSNNGGKEMNNNQNNSDGDKIAKAIGVIICICFALFCIGLLGETPELSVFAIVAGLISFLVFCLVAFVSGQIEQAKNASKNRILEELRIEEERHTEENLNKIVNASEKRDMGNKNRIPYEKLLKPDEDTQKPFQKPVYNYIEMMYAKEKFFFDPSFFMFGGNHFSYNRPDENKILCKIIERDGVTCKGVQKQTEVLADFIYKEILKQTGYTQELCAVATYGIIRYFIIKYFHDKYVAEIGYPTYQEYCENTNYYSRNDSLFFYYKQFENNIYAPLEKSYDEFAEKIKYYQAEFEKRDILNQLLNSENSLEQDDDDDIDAYFDGLSQEDEKSPISLIDEMDGREFELFIAELFKNKGYKAVATQASGDYGIDVIVENDLMRIGIQAKCYSNKVSNSAVQEAVTAKKHYGLDKVMVITNNYFTPSAIQLARDNNVTLWNRDKLIQEIENT